MTAKNKPLRILCFGDSLTYGYTNGGRDANPYSNKLRERIAWAFPNVELDVVTDGLSGDVATFKRFAKRLETACDKKPFDWVILLAGTNDFAYGIQPGRIFDALEACWDIAHSRNAKVLALTVPETAMTSPSLEMARTELNEMILSHQAPNFYSFNLRAKIPYHSLSDEDKDKYWDDGLHLTAAGYDWMGEFIASALLEILSDKEQKQNGASQAATKSKSPPAEAVEDEWVFEEEGGNPRQINQGYIVVRKSDLD